MRRLFSTFARSWPGAGLLLMRLVAGTVLIARGIEELRSGQPNEPAILDILTIGDGALLVVGLWTPIAGSLVLVFVAWAILSRHENPCSCILLATLGAALALLGPGAWSFDAWLFGWKRIDTRR